MDHVSVTYDKSDGKHANPKGGLTLNIADENGIYLPFLDALEYVESEELLASVMG